MPGRTSANQPATGRNVVRVFVSSTFRDMHAERDHLVTVVFPELRERVERLGLEFFDVDLRWGVPAKDANGETANSWEYCRQWIDRVEPFFVCILGQRYGWEPEPEQLKDPADRQLQQAQRRSITDLEVRHAVLNDRRKRRSYFYLRAAEAPASASEFVDPPPLLGKLKRLKDEILSCGRPVRPYPCRWTGEGFTEMEQFGRLALDDLWSGVLRDAHFVSKEVWRQALGADPDTDPLYTGESQPVPRELWEKILELAKPEPKDPLEAEREQMDAFAASRLRWFQGRTHELQQLTGFLDNPAADAPHLAVVAAVPGQGKSALLAKLHQQLKDSPHFVITHFVGATERSASAHKLVQRLLDELDRSGIAWPVDQQEGQEPKKDFNSLCLRLAMRLSDYAGERRIVILLDALNQLSDGHDLKWLPARLGPSVRVIVSCVEDSAAKADGPEQRVLQALGSRRPHALRVKVGALMPEDVRTIVVEYLEEYCKVLDTAQVDAICALPQARNPLYLLVMLGELRTLGGNDMNRIVGELIASMLQDHPDTVSIFRWVLQRLEVFGKEAVQWWCLYLAHGRVGMSSHELSDLLARKLYPDAAATAQLIERGLRRYLQRRGPQLDFFHGQLRQAVLEQYGPQVEATTVHSDIASYFRDLADPERGQSWKGDSPRPFLELVFHLASAQRLDEMCETLCDICYVEARCRHSQVFELIADYRLAQEHLPEGQEELRKERERQARLARWTEEITGYSRQWSARRDQLTRGKVVSEKEPQLPEPLATCRMWTDEEIDAECQRIIENPTRLDRMKIFESFVQQECYPLHEFGTRPGFVVQHAFNNAPRGPMHHAAVQILPAVNVPLLTRRWFARDQYNPRPALLRTLEGHELAVTSVSVTPDGRHAVSASLFAPPRVWDLETGQCIRVLEGHTSSVESVSVMPDGLCAVSASYDKTLRVWDLDTGQCLRVQERHTESVKGVSVTPYGLHAVSASSDNTLRVWNLETGRCLQVLEGQADYTGSVSVTPDGQCAVLAYKDSTLRVWNLQTGACLHELKGHTGTIEDVSVTPDGRRGVSVGEDRTLRVWDIGKGKCLRELEGHTDRIMSVSMTPDGQRAVSASYDATVRVWELETGKCLRVLVGHTGWVNSVIVTPDGKRAVSAGRDQTLRVWELDAGRCLRVSEGHTEVFTIHHVTRDGLHAISSYRDCDSRERTLQVWELETGVCVRELEGHTGDVNCVILTPDGQRAVSASADKTLRVWELETGRCLRVIKGHAESINCVTVMPDGLRAVSASSDKTLRVWELETGFCLRVLEGHTLIWRVTMTPDGQRAVSATFDMTFMEWDLKAGICLRVQEGLKSDVGVIEIPDGRLAVSVSDDNTLRVWDMEKGSCLRVLEGLTDVSVTPDGLRAVSASWDRTLRVWEPETGRCRVLACLLTPANSVAISSRLGRVIAGTSTGQVLQFDLRGMSLTTASKAF